MNVHEVSQMYGDSLTLPWITPQPECHCRHIFMLIRDKINSTHVKTAAMYQHHDPGQDISAVSDLQVQLQDHRIPPARM